MPAVDTVRPFLEASHLSLVASLELFVERRIVPLATPGDDDEARLQAREILELLGEGGWCRWAVPGDAGAVDLRACCLIREALAAASPLADSVFALQCLGAGPIVLGGDEEQRREWLPRIADGGAMAAFAMTEPEAGSDIAAMETRARRAAEGGGWVIDGRKTLITNAGIADLYSLFAVTGRRADGRPELSCFLVPADSDG
ncbi:MAG: acyl-CoA dehydrogenase family protein, partial [Thermoanaerobaculia bacterium]|nr:acyl-CoA dehydrogenase family protein [Thermoanaerobaculia bacterium]